MSKPNTSNGARKLDAATVRMVRNTHGMSKRICRFSGYSKGHVSDILAGRKRPTERFLDALIEATMRDAQDRNFVAVRSKYGREEAAR